MSNGNEEFVQRQIVGLKEPTGRLGEVLVFIETLPMHLPKGIVKKLARLAFINAYTQLAEERYEYDSAIFKDMENMYKENVEGMEELKSYCQECDRVVRNDIMTDIRKFNTPGVDDE